MKMIRILFFIMVSTYALPVFAGDCAQFNTEESIVCLEEKIDLIRDQIQQPPIEYRELEGLDKPDVTQVQLAQDFEFGLSSCYRNHFNVICHLQVTNLGSESLLALYSDSYFFDDLGNEFLLDRASIANKAEKFPITAGLEQTVLSAVPADMEVIFHQVPLDAGRVVRLELSLAKGRNAKRMKKFKIRFNNLAILVDDYKNLY